ncbi:MAG: prepilin-type N-terminal cleavage/methylation domain-containing protein [Actinomycetota bacterium]|nr:prepilin-type N-terminal cleavage/methylation domain-containing protein [Actinomycetota bacterium]
MTPRRSRDEAGFTLIELLVTASLFSVLAVGFYQVLFSNARGSDTSRAVVKISEEARLGLNRMIRDTREGTLWCETYDGASTTACPTRTSYSVRIDFNSDGKFENPNPQGDYEKLTFAYDSTRGVIALNGEVLVAGVTPISGKDIFTYTSNRLEYDANSDGMTTWQELDATGLTGIGDKDGVLDGDLELRHLSNIDYAFNVASGGRTTVFYSQAQLRNTR